MRMAALLAVASLFAAPAMAQSAPERWAYIGIQGGTIAWDRNSVERDTAKKTASINIFYYFSTPVTNQRLPYSFQFERIHFDCATHHFTADQGSFGDPTGTIIANMDPLTDRAVTEQTPEAFLSGLLCDDTIEDDAESADSRDAAIQAAIKAALPA